MHIHPTIRPTIGTKCDVSLFTTMISLDAAAQATGMSTHAVCSWAADAGIRPHQCCGIDYIPGNLLIRYLVKGPSGMHPQEALETATAKLAAMTDHYTRAPDRSKFRRALRASLAMAAALNEKEVGRQYDINEALALAFRPDLAASVATRKDGDGTGGRNG